MILSGDEHRGSVSKDGTDRDIGARHLRSLWSKVQREAKSADVVLLVAGLPGAGKSTRARREARPGVLVVDTCALTPEHRAPLVRAAKRARVPIDCLWMKTPIDTCKERRPGLDLGRMVRTMKKPKASEGFRRLRFAGGGA